MASQKSEKILIIFWCFIKCIRICFVLYENLVKKISFLWNCSVLKCCLYYLFPFTAVCLLEYKRVRFASSFCILNCRFHNKPFINNKPGYKRPSPSADPDEPRDCSLPLLSQTRRQTYLLLMLSKSVSSNVSSLWMRHQRHE